MTKSIKTYPVNDSFLMAAPPPGRHPQIRAIKIPGFRAPKKGEWYLSGAVTAAYRAKNDLTTEFHIARLVVVKSVTTEVILGPYEAPPLDQPYPTIKPIQEG